MASNRDRAKAKAKKKAQGQESWLETIKTVFWAVLIALLVRTFAYEPFSIPSGSMLPGLLVGDYLFVSKFSYGYSRYSFRWSPTLFSGHRLSDTPERGDDVVFRLQTDPKIDYIKRVVGLPGDRIQVQGGVLYVNGEPVERQRVEDWVDEDAGLSRPITRYIEHMPGGPSYQVLDLVENGSLDNNRVYEVPPGHVFAKGDNRDNSLDSRVDNVGFIPVENLIGRAVILCFSTTGEARLWEPWRWLGATRVGRLFKPID